MQSLKYCSIIAIACAVLVGTGCGKDERQAARQEFTLEDELKPLTPKELFEMPAENLDRVDIGRMNIICARNVTRTELVDTAKYVAKLDEWAVIAKRLEQKYLPAYEKNAARYDHSLAKFKAVTLALTIQQDLKCDYNMELIKSGAMNDMLSPRFFKNAEDVFITGLLKRGKGNLLVHPRTVRGSRTQAALSGLPCAYQRASVLPMG